jgi:hypothetical protein
MGKTDMRNPWLKLTMDAWTLSYEASSVIGLRMMKLAAGGAAAEAEAALMVNEKLEAGQALGLKAITGGLGVTAHGATASTLAHYRRKVRANRRRLSKP